MNHLHFQKNLKVWAISFALINLGFLYAEGETSTEPVTNGERVEYHDNGKIKIKENLKNGIRDGIYAEYDESGRPILNITYKKGNKHGSAKFYQNGRVCKEETWTNGFLLFPQTKNDIKAGFTKIKTLRIDSQGLPRTHVEALQRLMQHRLICGLSWEKMRLDKEWAKRCEIAAKSNSLNKQLSHTPTQPAKMNDEDYKIAYDTCSRSNLHMNSGKAYAIKDMIDGWMKDDGDNNKDMVGHRRWCLNPVLGATAFGVSNINDCYSAMWCFDNSYENPIMPDIIAYPAQGYQPKTHFSENTLWHVTLSSQKYKAPQKNKIKVEVRKTVHPGATFDLETAKKGKPVELTHFTVDTSGVGCYPNAIIFAPKNVGVKGTWLVSVLGVEEISGKETEVNYIVEFY